MERTIHDTPQRVAYDGQFGTIIGHVGYIGGRQGLQPGVIYDIEWLIGGTDEMSGVHLVEVSEQQYTTRRETLAREEALDQPPAASAARVAALERAARFLVGASTRRGGLDWNELYYAYELAEIALEIE